MGIATVTIAMVTIAIVMTMDMVAMVMVMGIMIMIMVISMAKITNITSILLHMHTLSNLKKRRSPSYATRAKLVRRVDTSTNATRETTTTITITATTTRAKRERKVHRYTMLPRVKVQIAAIWGMITATIATVT